MSERVGLADATLAGDEVIATVYGDVVLEDSFVTDESSTRLFDAMDAQRAAQAYIWALPLMGFAVWRDQQRSVFGASGFGDFVVYETLREKRGIVTANLTTPYIVGFAEVRTGPILIDYPAGATAGGVGDFWQRPVTDMGLTGPDQGAGGGYLVIGPEDDPDAFADSGRHVVQSQTNNIFIAFRVIATDPAEVAAAKAGLRISRVGEEPRPVRFIEGVDAEWSGTPPRGMAYWETLARVIGEEHIRPVDKVMTAMLEPLGIAPGESFAPDERQGRVLREASALGELMSRNLQINPRYTSPFWPGTQWFKSFDFDTEQETGTRVQLDERATWFYEAVTSSKGMVHPTPGAGQVYMTAKRDRAGALLRADRTYRLHVPPEVPVAQFWSVTLYSEETRRPYDNGGDEIRSISLDSHDPQLAVNDDGSVDILIGPDAPAGAGTNELRTVAPDGWFVYFRLYAPTERFFDKSWSLPDFEPVA